MTIGQYKVYVLISEVDGKHYTGLTRNLENRLKAHNQGKVTSTKSRAPFRLIYSEEVRNLKEARDREKFLKSHAGRNFLHKNLK